MSDTETPTKPTKTEEPPKTQIQSRYETIRVPILRPSEYPIWKVRMTMFLEATDPEYLDRIKEGPHKPTKLAVAVAGEAAKTVPKERGDYTAEDIASIAKDAKVRHLLHSAIDNVMSNRVINCKTAKEIWDALETRCQGTDTIKENRKTILTQEYEHFDSKNNESLNYLYDRFVKLLNDLSLVDKEYDLEDSNLKFLLALPECWDLKATTIRDNYNLDETTLDEIYGMLKTHKLEMEQRSKRKGGKSRTVALKAEEESLKAASSRKDKGKALVIKSDTESSSSESVDDSDSESLPETDADEEMMKLCALMVKGITKIAYRKFRKGKKFSRKGISSDKKNFRRSEGRGGKSDRGDYTNVKCYNCGEKGHICPDCKKVKGDKGKALVTKQKSWTDTSDSESEENYALMANVDKESAESSSEAAETKVPQTTYAFHTDDINELRRYLKTKFVSYRDQTLTCERLTSENLAFKKRNDFLEKELVMFHQTQKDRDDAFYVRDEVLKMNESLKTELEKEREIIRTWTNSGKTTQNLLNSGNWKEGLGYGEDKNDKGTEEIKPVVKQKPKLKPVKFVIVKSENEKSEVKEELTSDKLKQEKTAEVNIGLMTKKQLKHKLKDVKNANKVKSPRKNRNGKEGVNKSNNYKPVPDAPRKTCHNCGSSNHLASFCRKNKNINSLPSKSGVKSQSEYHSLYYDYYQIKPSLKKVSIVPSSVNSDSKSDNGNRKNILVLDSGCSGHMTGNKALLSDFMEKAGPSVSYGDGNIGKTLGYGNINLGNVIIKDVALVSGLKHNLLSKVVLKGYRRGNIYEAKLSTSTDGSAICLMSRASIEESWNWHKKLSHLNFNNINELVKKDLVRGLPKSVFAPDVNVMSIAKKKYALVIVDEFTRYTWVYFLHTKSKTASILIDHVKHLDKLLKDSVKILRSDNGTEFKNLMMEEFYKNHGIKQEFSAPGTPQQNGVVERKNRTLIEAARTMLEEAKLPTYLWAETVQTACFTQNATLINKHGKTPYEMVKKKKPNLKYFHVFGCKCFVLKTHPEQLSKFDLKSDEGIFVGYPLSTKAFRVYNLRTKVVMESINVSFDDKKITGLEDFIDHDQLRFENEDSNSDTENPDSLSPDTVNSDGLNSDVIEIMVTKSKEDAPISDKPSSDSAENLNSEESNSESIVSGGASENENEDSMDHGGASSSRENLPSARKWTKSHTPDLIIGNPDTGVRTRTGTSNECLYNSFLSQTEPKKVEEALQDADWVQAMQEELNEFERNKVWTLVPRPKNRSVVGTKWVFRNKTDSDGIIIRNKARLVVKGYSQQEGIDYDETFAPVINDQVKLLMKVQRSVNRLYKIVMEECNPMCLLSKAEEQVWLWHARLGYTRKVFPAKTEFMAKERLELIHADHCGPISPPTTAGNRYVLLLVDDFRSAIWIFLLRSKDQALEAFKKFKSLVEKEAKNTVKLLRTDRGGEFMSKEFKKFCENAGVKRYLTAPYTPQQNEVVERRNRIMIAMTRSLLKEKGFPSKMWGEAVRHAIYILNRLPTKALTGKTPYEAWLGTKPRLDHICVFGCLTHVKIQSNGLGKLDGRSVNLIYIGRELGTKAHKLYNPTTGRVHVSRDVEEGEEANFPSVHTPGSQNSSTQGSVYGGNNFASARSSSFASKMTGSSSEAPPQFRLLSDIYKNTEEIVIPDEELLLIGIEEPRNFEKAKNSEDWNKAMRTELEAIEANKTWVLTDLPAGRKPISLKWVYKIKKDTNGDIVKYKARLVAKGYVQKKGIDYDEIFAPVTRIETVRLLLVLVAKQGWQVHHLDVKSAFLNGELLEEVYVSQPVGFEKKREEHKVYHLLKALYGLRQSPRARYSRLNKYLKNLDFSRCPYDHAVYTRPEGPECLIVVVYVDDFPVTGSKMENIMKFKKQMQAEFDMSDLGMLAYYLGLEVNQGTGFIEVKHTTYAKCILKKVNIQTCKPVRFLMDSKVYIGKDEGGELVDSTLYRSIIGELRYLVHTRPDISYSVGVLSRYMESPTRMHLNDVKKVLRYVKGTLDYGLVYKVGSGNYLLSGYSDSDHAGCVDDRKSTTAATQGIWLQNLLKQVVDVAPGPSIIFMDNKSTIDLTKNPIINGRSKHIDMQFHFIRDCVECGEIVVKYVKTQEQRADILTKPLTALKFEEMRKLLGVKDLIRQV
ncbi:hypothetical protein AgCh_014672 [Apium graveolens]